MKKLYFAWLIFSVLGSVLAQGTEGVGRKAAILNDVPGTASSKDVAVKNQNNAAAGVTYSLIGSAFYKGDGATQAYWDYDIDLTYTGTVGDESFYELKRQEFLLDGEFKIRQNHNWTDPSFGTAEITLVSPDLFGWMGVNIKVLSRKVYDLTFIVNNVTNTHTLSMQYSLPLKPTAVINKASSAPVIDGSVDAVWATANTYNIDQSVVGANPTLGASGTTIWRGLWTTDGIYILVNVNDDVFFPAYLGASPSETWMYDKPEIYLDVNSSLGDGLGASAPNSGHYQIARDFVAAQINGTPVTDYLGVKNAYLVTGSTYTAEYFIPFTLLNDKNGVGFTKTSTVGFDVTIIDRDSEAGFKQRAVWTNFGLQAESWVNMDDCGTAILVGPGANNIVTGIIVSGAATATTITKEAGTLQMNAAITPADATNQAVTWTVVNGTGKASISATGLLTAEENGTVTVTATAKDGSGISGSTVITISNQYISYADGSRIRDGGFETDGPILNSTLPNRWFTWSDIGGTATVTSGLCTIVPGTIVNPLENWHMQLVQTGWKVGNDTSFVLSFTAWASTSRTFSIDFEDPNNGYTRFGSSTDPEAVNGRSDWVVNVTTTPTVFTFHTTIDGVKATTKYVLNILTSNALGTIYIDNISLVSVGHLKYGNGPPAAGTAASSSTICSGTSAKMTLAGSLGYIKWQQSTDGLTGWVDVTGGTGTDSVIYSTQNISANTYYRARVSNMSFADVYSNSIMVTVNPLPGAAGVITGASQVCHDQVKNVSYIVPLIANTAANAYVWTLPTGATGSSSARTISVKYGPTAISGNLTVKGHNACGDGPVSTLPVIVRYPYESEKICMVTVDLETGKNMVVWEKTPNKGIANYHIYREGISIGQYDLIGIVLYDQMSVYVDLTSKPEQQQYTYKISAVDTCGNESAMSPWHQTMFLQWTGSVSGVNLSWQKYDTEDKLTFFTTYAIFRGSASSALTQIKSLASSSTVFTDGTAEALTQKMYYRVGGVKASPCVSTGIGKKATPGPYVHSLSNLEDNRLQGTGLNNKTTGAFNPSIYPSPFTESANISYNLENPAKMRVEIYNVVGEKIGILLDEKQSAGNHILEINASDVNYSNGLYYVRITIEDNVFIRKVMYNR